MEFRWLARTVLSPRPLYLAPSSSSYSSCCSSSFSSCSSRRAAASAPAIRRFSHSPRFSAGDLPAAGAAPTPAETPPAKRGTAILQELFGLAASSGTAPPRRDPRFSSILPTELSSRSPNAPPLGAKPTPRTGPSAGRTVSVITDLPQALSRLRGILTANNVKVDQLRQRFHERPGKKKNRLKSLRHRKRFKAGFKRLVTIAMEMKRKGL